MKQLKTLALFTVLFVVSACSTSGNDTKNNGTDGGTGGNGGESETITGLLKDLQGTWEGSDPNSPPNSFIFTKQNVNVEGSISIFVEEVTLKDGRSWAIYHDDEEQTFPYTIYYIDGQNLYYMTGASKQEILNEDKNALDQAALVVVATKKL